MVEDNQFYDENGHETNGKGSSDSHDGSQDVPGVVDLPSQLIKLDGDSIRNLCNDWLIDAKGSKFELIGRVLKEIDQFPKEDLFNFNEKQLKKMCLGIKIESEGTKNDLVNRLYQTVNVEVIDDINGPSITNTNTNSTNTKNLKRYREDDEILNIIKKRKLELPMKSSEFMNKAEQLTLVIENNTYKIIPKEYSSTNSYGWYQTGRQTIDVDGVSLNVAWNINMTVLGK